MRLQDSILVLSSGLLSQFGLALAKDPPLPPWYPLKPWEITTFHATNPRDAPYGANTTSLNITISNTHSIPAGPAPHASGGGYVVFSPSTANCLVHWKRDAQTPYGNTKATCDSENIGATEPQWNITINEIQDLAAGHYMSISFSLAYRLHAYGSDFFKQLSGSIAAREGEHFEGGCNDAGFCEYNLKNESEPLLIQPTLFECKYACG